MPVINERGEVVRGTQPSAGSQSGYWPPPPPSPPPQTPPPPPPNSSRRTSCLGSLFSLLLWLVLGFGLSLLTRFGLDLLLQEVNLPWESADIAQDIAIILIGFLMSRWLPRGSLRKLAFFVGYVASPVFLLYEAWSYGLAPAPAVTIATAVVSMPTAVSEVVQVAKNDSASPSTPTARSDVVDPSAASGTGSVSTSVRDSQALGRITVDKLNIRRGPGVTYPVIRQERSGTTLRITGKNPSATWWLIQLADGSTGWVTGDYVEESGCTECVPTVIPSPPPTKKAPTPTSRPQPTNTQVSEVASNRTSFSGEQGANSWKYLVESSRNSGIWQPMVFDGVCYRAGNWENDVRICANGEVHPGQSTRIAYEWRPSVAATVTVSVHAHKIDTRCGDGIWLGIDLVRDNRGIERELGSFHIGGSDNQGKTQTYRVVVDPGNLIYVIVDIHGDSTCDLTRVLIDIR